MSMCVGLFDEMLLLCSGSVFQCGALVAMLVVRYMASDYGTYDEWRYMKTGILFIYPWPLCTLVATE